MNIHVANAFLPRSAAATVAAKRPFVLALRGFVCDRYTDAGMQGASLLARAAAARLHAPLRELGVPEPAIDLGWRENLAKASPYLRDVAGQLDELMRDHRLPFIFANRCGVSLATIAAMLRHRPDATIVWCDAHGDFNTPATTPTGYLGGMVLSALCGLWDSGFGAGLSPDRIVLAGARDLDPGERELIAAHGVRVIAARDGIIDTDRVIEALDGAPVWLHIDTDVVDPLYLPAEYRVGGGLHPAALCVLVRELVQASELVGFELTEFEAPSNPGRCARAVQTVLRLIEPVLLAGGDAAGASLRSRFHIDAWGPPVSDGMEEAVAIPTSSFVDGLWLHLEAAVSPLAGKRLAAFARQRGVTKWIIATDYCIRDKSRPNDSFAFVIFPAGQKLEETNKILARLPARDLKDVKRIPPSLQRILRKGRVFTFSFVADRFRRLFLSPDVARRSIDDTIAMMEKWENATACENIIAKVRAMRAEANKANLNTRLLEDIIVTTAIVSYIVMLMRRYSLAELIGWAPDRDKITESYHGIASTMFAVNVSALCQREKIPAPKLGFFVQKDDDLWCDPYIRLANYVAGAASAWDLPVHDVVPAKIASLIKGAFADNRYLFVFRIAFHAVDNQCRCEIRHVAIRSRPVGSHQRRNRLDVTPLQKRSRQLT